MPANSLTIAGALVLLGAMVLSGCASYQWQKHGATQADFNVDSYQCRSEAAALYPTYMVNYQMNQGRTTPATTNCYGYGNNLSCTTTPGQNVGGVSVPIDVNANRRAGHVNQCLYARGWQNVRVK